MHAVDILIIAGYLVALVAIGVAVAGRQKTTDSCFVAGRTVPGWAAGLSLLATIITSVSFIAYPGAAYAGNWNLLVPGILFVAVIVAIGPVVVHSFVTRCPCRLTSTSAHGLAAEHGCTLRSRLLPAILPRWDLSLTFRRFQFRALPGGR